MDNAETASAFVLRMQALGYDALSEKHLMTPILTVLNGDDQIPGDLIAVRGGIYLFGIGSPNSKTGLYEAFCLAYITNSHGIGDDDMALVRFLSDERRDTLRKIMRSQSDQIAWLNGVGKQLFGIIQSQEDSLLGLSGPNNEELGYDYAVVSGDRYILTNNIVIADGLAIFADTTFITGSTYPMPLPSGEWIEVSTRRFAVIYKRPFAQVEDEDEDEVSEFSPLAKDEDEYEDESEEGIHDNTWFHLID